MSSLSSNTQIVGDGGVKASYHTKLTHGDGRRVLSEVVDQLCVQFTDLDGLGSAGHDDLGPALRSTCWLNALNGGSGRANHL